MIIIRVNLHLLFWLLLLLLLPIHRYGISTVPNWARNIILLLLYCFTFPDLSYVEHNLLDLLQLLLLLKLPVFHLSRIFLLSFDHVHNHLLSFHSNYVHLLVPYGFLLLLLLFPLINHLFSLLDYHNLGSHYYQLSVGVAIVLFNKAVGR